MGRYRALLTDTDRDYLKMDPNEMDDRNKRDQSVTRTRSRIRALEEDIAILEEEHPQLLEEVRDVVCDSE